MGRIWSQIVETLATFWARRATVGRDCAQESIGPRCALALPREVLPTSEPRISGEGRPAIRYRRPDTV